MNGDRRMNWDEIYAFSALIAAFYARNGRDPIDREYDDVIATARQMAADGYSLLH